MRLQFYFQKAIVAPLVGAWIEIKNICYCFSCGALVAPLVGAWIEIVVRRINDTKSSDSRSSRGSVD